MKSDIWKILLVILVFGGLIVLIAAYRYLKNGFADDLAESAGQEVKNLTLWDYVKIVLVGTESTETGQASGGIIGSIANWIGSWIDKKASSSTTSTSTSTSTSSYIV